MISLSGCGSLSRFSLEPLGSKEREKAPDRVLFEHYFPEWQLVAGCCPGLYFTSARILEPRLEFWAVRADLSEPSLRIVINSKNTSIRVSSFVRENGLLAGINAVPFEPVSSREGEKRLNVGIVVSDGVITTQPVSSYDALVFYKNDSGLSSVAGRAVIKPQAEIVDIGSVENAIGGFRIILSEGELPERLFSPDTTPRHPRSAVGLSADGRTLYLLVIDGRRPGSIGATEAETGLILKKLGVTSGLNLDGGGSSALALRLSNGRVRTMNTPIHSGIPGRERAVAACLGIKSTNLTTNGAN